MQETQIAVIAKNSTERIQVELSEFKGVRYVDVRTYVLPEGADEWRPSKKGITVKPERLAEFIVGLQQVEAQARAAGLLGDRSAVA